MSDDARRIFVLAALSVYSFPTHLAHWAFWARNSRMRVLQLVHEVVCEKPQRIIVPGEVAWLDVEYNYIGLCNYQKPWLPETPRPSGVHAPEPQPKKPVKTRVVPRRGATRAKPAPAPAAPEAVPPRIGKRKRAAEATEVTGRAAEPARKRPKRGAAAAAEACEKEQKGGATRGEGGTRSTQGTRERSNGGEDEEGQAPPPTIHVDPPSEADMTVNHEPCRTDLDVIHNTRPTDALKPSRRARSHSKVTLDTYPELVKPNAENMIYRYFDCVYHFCEGHDATQHAAFGEAAHIAVTLRMHEESSYEGLDLLECEVR
ncbi:hypothetical protein OH77DRAFT_1524857 [Trametes cingulata]|nr:hypothetical protein OH77DRAFT_1524857 [Trametes cingulata]